ncbi:MAG TPA: DMT family transporter [Lactobacillaceae bacterium]|jgi:drug/metabolite transporter (DMT)-like permease
MSDSQKGIILNILSVLVMAITPVMNKFSLSSLSPLQASLFNSLIAAGFSLLYMLVRRQKLTWIIGWPIWLLGITNAFGIVLQYYSLSILNPVTVGLIGRFYIVFAILLSITLLNERFQRKDFLPIALAIIGSFAVANTHNSVELTIGILFAFAYTFFFALTNTLAKKLVHNENSNVVLFYNQIISAIMIGIYTLTQESPIPQSFDGIEFLIASAFFSGFLGLILFYEGIKYIPFSQANIIRSINPIVVFIYSYYFFPIKLTPSFMFGAILIIASVIIMSWPNKKSAT